MNDEHSAQGGGMSKRRTLGIIAGVAAGVAVILVIALIVALTAGGAPAPTPTPSPTSTTSAPTPSPTPGTPAVITSFTAESNTAVCTATTGLVQVALSWKVEHAAKIAIASAPQQEDALVHPFENNLPASEDRFLIPFSCANEQWAYTLSAVGAAKPTVSQVITITRSLVTPTPTPSPTPTPVPTPTPTPTPVPPAPAPYIVSFTATPDAISCEAAESFELAWEVANLGADDTVVLAVHVKENAILVGLGASGTVEVPSEELAGFCDGQEEFYWLSVTDGKKFADRQGIQVINLDDPPLIQG